MLSTRRSLCRFVVGKPTDEETAKIKRVKGILNKLTPENFEKLFQQMIDVEINNATTLTMVIAQVKCSNHFASGSNERKAQAVNGVPLSFAMRRSFPCLGVSCIRLSGRELNLDLKSQAGNRNGVDSHLDSARMQQRLCLWLTGGPIRQVSEENEGRSVTKLVRT